MKIFEVEIENFRQYQHGSFKLSTDERNFTVVQGDNGGGKSNIMNAIIWCIYGDEIFISKKNEGRDIVNENAIQEVPLKESVDVSVTVKMGEDEVKYIVTRKVRFTKYPAAVTQGSTYFEIRERNDSGTVVKPYPEYFIEQYFIPRDLRGFFFFDGEKMDEYFEDTSKVKSKVQKIAQIDILQNAINTIDSTLREINDDIKKIKPEYLVNVEEIELKETERDKAEEKQRQIKEQIVEMELEIKKIDNYLRNNSDEFVRERQSHREDLKRQQSDLAKAIDENEKSMRTLIVQRAPILMAVQSLISTEKLISQETEKGVLPPNVKDVFLKDLLEKGKCICGRDLAEDTECRRMVEDLLHKIMPSDISYDATKGRYVIEEMLKKKDFIEEYRALLEKRTSLNVSLEEINESIAAVSEQLAKYDLIEIANKEEERRNKVKVLGQYHTRVGTLGNQIVNLNREISELREALDRQGSNDRNMRYLQKQYNYGQKLRANLFNVKETILDDVRVQLEQKTRDYFFRMIWKRDAFSDVRILDLGSQYKISVLSKHGNECLGDISAGERQVLALAFTAALYSVSGYSVPVIIDTPMGRISGSARDNIASALPNYLSETQVLMLATDTEYTDTVRGKLKNSVGAEYRIKHDEDTGISEVVSYE